MIIKRLFLLCFIGFIISCKSDIQLNKIVGQRLSINDSIEANIEIEAFIKPYRENVTKDLDSVLAYAVDTYSKTNGELNTAIGNFMADALFEESNPIFNKRTGKSIDMVLLNHGGIRSIISKGNLTSRSAYQIMPFDNEVVIVALKGTQVRELLDYLSNAKRAHPISKLKLVLDTDYNIVEATISGNPIDDNKIYNVATNDFLFDGGDRMIFFKTNEGVENINYKLRNLFIDHFKKIDTLNPVIDDRFIQLKQ
jgi:2',3'-cyclic-nucleotide 2'-phosphodiesterase (5'-nucleotidase family)